MAYCGSNTVAAIGRVLTGKYLYEKQNIIGKSEYRGGFGYPSQKEVKWFKKPRYFKKDKLPFYMRDRITTCIIIPSSVKIFLQELKNIPEEYRGTFNEDAVKAGISRYLKRNINKLEYGLELTRQETSIDENNRPDFLAKDRNGKHVTFECKGFADEKAIDQINRYPSKYHNRKKFRRFLIATYITNDCKKEAKRNGIEVFETYLKSKKVV